MEEETLRLQFGSAATTIGTQWLTLQQSNRNVERLHVLAFEAKGRVKRQIRVTSKQEDQNPITWGGNVEVYDQSGIDLGSNHDGLWNWKVLNEQNLVEVDEFRPYLPLHNFYEGRAICNGGSISLLSLEKAEDRVRTVLETCDQLKVVQNLVDMDSSWGGLAYEIMTYVIDECPRAVVMTIGNDWSYPLNVYDDSAEYCIASSIRDRTKNEARMNINVASSISLLSEVSHLLVPVAMSSKTLLNTTFPHLEFNKTSCVDVSSIIATALELALSGFQDRPAYELLKGFNPHMKVVELAALFPYNMDPTSLLQCIGDSVTNEVRSNILQQDPFCNYSLLPTIQHATSDQNLLNKSFYRHLHFRGSFHGHLSLQSAFDSFPVSSRDVTLQWSSSSLFLPTSYRLSTLQNSLIDGITQLSSNRKVGKYLSTLGHLVATSNKRMLHEFTRVGMSPDAPEELKSHLATLSDPYLI
ncbi:putative DML1/Misato, tubulin domain, tubulin/FtsZ, GTPase domain superfamily [Plasmopara halstedii]